jgi:hypothetical protein
LLTSGWIESKERKRGSERERKREREERKSPEIRTHPQQTASSSFTLSPKVSRISQESTLARDQDFNI